MPAVIDPPGELMNNLISLFESSASKSKSWLMTKSAVVSSTCPTHQQQKKYKITQQE